jgi:D-alanyl-D-alanine carboxypeptidase/D-alanyl-D-alanine-endopeptidase (penicillin-binding protein 4)
VPPDLKKPFLVHRSRSLGDVIRLVNKHSNNVMTRNLELTLGAETFGAPATEEKGRRAIYALLAGHGIDTRGLVISNSAGLSRDSRISARQLANVLQASWQSPYMSEFMSSLSIAGMDGTLKRRLRKTPAFGRLHMKTGSLDDVSAVAGYVMTRAGRRLMVVVMINAPNAHRGIGEDFQDVALRWAVDQ